MEKEIIVTKSLLITAFTKWNQWVLDNPDEVDTRDSITDPDYVEKQVNELIIRLEEELK
jgi:hypothetical protein